MTTKQSSAGAKDREMTGREMTGACHSLAIRVPFANRGGASPAGCYRAIFQHSRSRHIAWSTARSDRATLRPRGRSYAPLGPAKWCVLALGPECDHAAGLTTLVRHPLVASPARWRRHLIARRSRMPPVASSRPSFLGPWRPRCFASSSSSAPSLGCSFQGPVQRIKKGPQSPCFRAPRTVGGQPPKAVRLLTSTSS